MYSCSGGIESIELVRERVTDRLCNRSRGNESKTSEKSSSSSNSSSSTTTSTPSPPQSSQSTHRHILSRNNSFCHDPFDATPSTTKDESSTVSPPSSSPILSSPPTESQLVQEAQGPVPPGDVTFKPTGIISSSSSVDTSTLTASSRTQGTKGTQATKLTQVSQEETVKIANGTTITTARTIRTKGPTIVARGTTTTSGTTSGAVITMGTTNDRSPSAGGLYNQYNPNGNFHSNLNSCDEEDEELKNYELPAVSPDYALPTSPPRNGGEMIPPNASNDKNNKSGGVDVMVDVDVDGEREDGADGGEGGEGGDVARDMEPISPLPTHDVLPSSSSHHSQPYSPHSSNRPPRERGLTDDSSYSAISDSTPSSSFKSTFSKGALVRLMREQVDLVRSLTNAQIAQKKELEKVKEEKRRLEELQARQMMQQQQLPMQEQRMQQQVQVPPKVQGPRQVHEEVRQGRHPNTHPNSHPYSQSAPPAPSLPQGSSPTPNRERLYSSDRSIISRFRSYRYNHHNPRNRAFSGDSTGDNRENRGYSVDNYEENTLANGDPSMASTIMPTNIVIGAGMNGMQDPHNMYPHPPHPSHPSHAPYTGPGAYYNTGYNRDKIDITPIPERNVVPPEKTSCLIYLWLFFSRLCTLFLPDVLLVCAGNVGKNYNSEESRQAKQAWREKVAIFVIMLLSSAAFIGISGVIPMMLCRETVIFTMDEIQARTRTEDWTVVFGGIYDIQNYIDLHPGGLVIEEMIGKDASKLFPRRPVGRLPEVCTNPDVELETEPKCDEFDDVDQLVNLYCHDAVGFSGVSAAIGQYERGVLAHRMANLKNDPYTEWIMIYGRIYNVTRYVEGLKNPESGLIDLEWASGVKVDGTQAYQWANNGKGESMYLSRDLTGLIVNKRGQDATAVYEALFDGDVVLSCLDDLFYVGVMDEQDEILCRALNIAMYAVMIVIAAVLAIQCACSLIYLIRMKRTITRDDTRSKIIVMVPCYNEGDKELRKTIDSVMDTSYPDDNKVLFVIADGSITGKGERISTPETLARILGYKMSPKDKAHKCKSIGELTENRAKIYYGTYKDCGKELKYIVLVKCGLQSERGSSKPGNRGKRDSQLLFSGLLNRFHHGRPLNDLDTAIQSALEHLQIPLDEVRYLMAIDADTRIEKDSISHMTYSMNKNAGILALCGETKVENKGQSWVTMIQVFEYYTNHHMKKAFESVFGCVTCLPGCFTMYRLFSDDGRPLLSCDDVYQRYATNSVKTLHEKNLYHLGEDRMLTTLLLRYFPDMKLSFVPEATCYTIVPHRFSVLLSQRRRWINSTFHNMLELLRVNTMCGVCCISMKSVVMLDLLATLILPASLVYVGYIVYITFWMGEPLSLLMLVVWGIVVGVQVVVFLLRSRWDYWWWFFVFLLVGVPVFYFILPIYSFWHMDDFSWGKTRAVDEQAASGSLPPGPLKSDDETECSRESPRGFEVSGFPGKVKVEEVNYGPDNGPGKSKKRSDHPATSDTQRPQRHDNSMAHSNSHSTPRTSNQNISSSSAAYHHHQQQQQHPHQRNHPIDVDKELENYEQDYEQPKQYGQPSKQTTKPQPDGKKPIDVDAVSVDDFSCEVTVTPKIMFDPDKYMDAEEAKRVRRMRRGAC